MKYSINLVAIAVVMCIFLVLPKIDLAQDWELDGNNTISPTTDFLGTTDATPIPFRTDDEERMRLTSTGLLGLGITTPQNCFHIHDAFGAGINLTTDGTGSTGGDGMSLSMTNTNFQFRLHEDLPMLWYTNSLPRMTLTNIGRLGLNTTAPVSLFHVEDGTVVFNGTTGANPNYNSTGTRMMWIAEQGAFRGDLA